MTSASSTTKATAMTSVRTLHPEDICVGDNVAIMSRSVQVPTFMWCNFDTSMTPMEKPVRMTFLPDGEQEALRVSDVCLPFIICDTYDNKHVFIDLRQTQLARLDAAFAKADRKARKNNDREAASAKKKSRKSKKSTDKRSSKKKRK